MALNGDYIETLPKDKKTGDYETHKPVMDKVVWENKNLLPQIDALILKNIPNSNNMLVMYGVKCFFIILLYYLFRNVKFMGN